MEEPSRALQHLLAVEMGHEELEELGLRERNAAAAVPIHGPQPVNEALLVVLGPLILCDAIGTVGDGG